MSNSFTRGKRSNKHQRFCSPVQRTNTRLVQHGGVTENVVLLRMCYNMMGLAMSHALEYVDCSQLTARSSVIHNVLTMIFLSPESGVVSNQYLVGVYSRPVSSFATSISL